MSQADLLFTDRGGCVHKHVNLSSREWSRVTGDDFPLSPSGAHFPSSVYFHHIPVFDDTGPCPDGHCSFWADNIVRQADAEMLQMPHRYRMGGVVTLRDAFVTGTFAAAFDCQVSYMAGGCWSKSASFPVSMLERSSVDLEKAVVIAQVRGSSFFHWFMENFTRLAIVFEWLVANPDVKIIAYDMKYAKGSTLPFYTMVGLDPMRVVLYNPAALYFVRRLGYPTATRCGIVNRAALRLLQNLFHLKLSTVPFSKQRIILVQDRGHKKTRSLSNHHELVSRVKTEFPRTEVRVFGPADSLLTVASAHFHAILVIAPHGAGLANLIFCQIGATAIEVHPISGNAFALGHKTNLCHLATALAA
eukprot:3937845-Rhodomonas_salina.1